MSNSNLKIGVQYRQGDVQIERVDDSLEFAAGNEIKRTKRGLVLAEGEVTGHAHRIVARRAKLYRSETDARYMRVMGPAPVALTHEEHFTRCQHASHPVDAARDMRPRATHHGESGYWCAEHAPSDTVMLADPGSTVIPPGTYRVTIHAEYVPGELHRTVED